MTSTRLLKHGLRAIAAVAATVTALNLATAPVAAQEDITVGVVLPLTSVLAPYGTPTLDALELAVDQINEDGGIEGRKIKLEVEDTQASNTVAINAINKVLRSEPVAVFGPALGTQILAMMPITERQQVPLIAGPSTRRVTQEGASYYWRNSTHDGVDKENWTRFIVEGLGKKKVGIMHVANEWGYSGRDNTAKFLKELYDVEPVAIASYQPTDKDLTAQIRAMTEAGAEVIVTQGHPVDEALIVRQLEQLGVDAIHIGSGSLCMAYLRELVTAEEIEGHYCEGPDMIPPANDRPAVQEFVKAYRERSGLSPDIYATHYYDVMGMLAAIMKEYGADRESIKKGMSEMSYEGVIGTYKADEEGNLWHDAVVMKFLADGEIEVVRRFSE